MPRSTYLGGFELLVMLALLRLGEDAYGVTIAEELEARMESDVALGSVYVTLERLEQKGYASSSLGIPTPERGGRAKRHFRATAAGTAAVRGVHRVLSSMVADLPALKAHPA